MVRAAVTFLLTDPETFSYRVIRAGEQIPQWALDTGRVTHPDIFADDGGFFDEPDAVVEDDTGGDDESGQDPAEEDDVSRETETSEEDPDTEEDEDLESIVVNDDEDDQPRPDSDWKKADILNYAMSNGIQIAGSETKDQLLALIDEEEG